MQGDLMKVNVLFFGATADIVGEREVEITVTESASAKAVFEDLLTRFPRLKAHRLLFSINQEYADQETTVSEGDELAIFTAVSGG